MSTVRIQVRRGTASEWTAANPILAAGEMGVETNTNLFKFGNGTSTWTALSYANNSDVAIAEISQDAINAALTLGSGLTKTYNDGANTITITVDTAVVSTKAFATAEAAAARVAAATYTDAAVSGVNNSLTSYLEVADRGVANGVASLNGSGKLPESQLQLTGLTTAITTSGNVSADNVTVGGNLVVNGTTTTINTANFTTKDTLIYLAEDNRTNQLDIGFVGGHNDGVYNHTGLVLDASDGKWKLFTGVTDEPTTTINFAQGTLAPLSTGELNTTKVVTPWLNVSGTVELPASTITSANIQENSITANKIATDSIAATKLQSNSVTTLKIADLAVTGDKLGALAVTTGKITDSAVSTEKIADNAITSAKVAIGSIIADKLAASSVTEAKIADSSVTASKIATSAVATAKIENAAVTEAKIADSSVTENKIALSAVTTLKIADNAITNAKVADAGLTTSKIAGLDTALSARSPIASPTFTGTVVLPATTSIGAVSSTEIGYVDGVTSSIQTQLTSGVTALANHEADTTNIHGIADTALLATTANVATAKSEAITAAGSAADTKVSTAVAALTKSSVGLANVDNTSDASKPVSTAQATAIATAKSEAIASATASVTSVINGAPAAFDTLKEIADYIATDQSAGSALTSSVALKAPIASPTFTGTVTVGAAGIVFSDGTQTKAGVPSITTIGTARSASETLAAGEQDKFVPVSGAVVITLPATGYSTGQSIDFWQQTGTGASFASTNGVVGTPGLKFRTTNSVVTAMKISSGWLVFGDLSA